MRFYLPLVTLLIVGCGSGGAGVGAIALVEQNSSPTTNVQTETRLFQTRVIDGYISGANVYIDFNMNLVQDNFEPSAQEDTTNKTYYWEEDAFSNIPNFNEECEGNRPYIAEIPFASASNTSLPKLYTSANCSGVLIFDSSLINVLFIMYVV